jgi:hypothetical protein
MASMVVPRMPMDHELVGQGLNGRDHGAYLNGAGDRMDLFLVVARGVGYREPVCAECEVAVGDEHTSRSSRLEEPRYILNHVSVHDVGAKAGKFGRLPDHLFLAFEDQQAALVRNEVG